MKPSTPGALARITEAMEHVERAQQCLDRACQSLSPVRGALRTYEATGREYDRVHALWYRIQKLAQRNGLSLDSEAP